MKVVVEILGGARAGRRLVFEGPRTVRFGRHPDNDVAFDARADLDASARHAELRLASGGYRLFDLGSANGTLVGGDRIGFDGLPLDDAEVLFGGQGPRCRIRVVSEGSAAPPTSPEIGPRATTPSRSPASPEVHKLGPKTVAGIVEEVLRKAGGGRRRLGLVVGAVALGGSVLGAIAALSFRGRPSALRNEIGALIAAQSGADDAERARLQKKIDELSARLGARADIARQNRGAVFLVAAQGREGMDGFCTAFAVTPRRLLTNAHCVELAEELRRKSMRIEVVANGGSVPRPVVAWKKAAGFRRSAASVSADVGWLEVEADLPERVRLAPTEVLERISAGDLMSTYGFPGRLTDAGAPEATYVTGVIGRVTNLDGRPSSPAEQRLLQHSAYTSPGTSGSPLFDAEGRVIGINAGGYLDDGAAHRPLPGYNFGLRVDMATALLNEADE